MDCCSPSSWYLDAERQFDSDVARRDLVRYRRKGPDGPSRALLEALRRRLRLGDSLLDIGAGVGVLDFELLHMGVNTATLVEASPAYVEAAGREAEQRGLSDYIHRVVGDFTGLVGIVAPAHVVTLHRVVCCYRDYEALLGAAAKHARRVLAFSYPRNHWHIRAWLALENARRRVMGNPFRVYVHSPAAMERLVVDAGFKRLRRKSTLIWRIDVYERA
jgi:2-polyprenyl-3-methyl-5-hydroxy-6-metoxy-1,4-benzoquinol methylase